MSRHINTIKVGAHSRILHLYLCRKCRGVFEPGSLAVAVRLRKHTNYYHLSCWERMFL